MSLANAAVEYRSGSEFMISRPQNHTYPPVTYRAAWSEGALSMVTRSEPYARTTIGAVDVPAIELWKVP
jgi:hypothetical protein